MEVKKPEYRDKKERWKVIWGGEKEGGEGRRRNTFESKHLKCHQKMQ